jgi:hypothetical protein
MLGNRGGLAPLRLVQLLGLERRWHPFVVDGRYWHHGRRIEPDCRLRATGPTACRAGKARLHRMRFGRSRLTFVALGTVAGEGRARRGRTAIDVLGSVRRATTANAGNRDRHGSMKLLNAALAPLVMASAAHTETPGSALPQQSALLQHPAEGFENKIVALIAVDLHGCRNISGGRNDAVLCAVPRRRRSAISGRASPPHSAW